MLPDPNGPHRGFYSWAARTLRRSETQPDRLERWLAILLALAFTGCGVAIWLLLNAGALLFGIYASPVWRSPQRFHFFFLPGRIPVIVIAGAAMLAYALWRSWLENGLLIAVAPIVTTAALILALFGSAIALNAARRKSINGN